MNLPFPQALPSRYDENCPISGRTPLWNCTTRPQPASSLRNIYLAASSIFHLWYIIYFFEGELGLEDQSPYWKMTADFGRRSLQMHIDWAEQCAAELRSAK